jgi:diadenosine tetraphosphate (Ap4A) HIT family hydrolase
MPAATATPICNVPAGSSATPSSCGVAATSLSRPSWPVQEASGYWLEVLQVASALQRHYRPVKMNYQTLGNAVPHLHTHLVPRFAQDPAPGRPLPFPEGERPLLPEETVRRDAFALRALV